MIAFARIVLRLLADVVGLAAFSIRFKRSIEAENLLLRRQLALYQERGVRPRRIDAATRVSLAWLSRLCDWRSCLIVVRPDTVSRWHRARWRLWWRYKSQPWRGFMLITSCGFTDTVFNEWRNVYQTGAWAYASEMPLVLGIGRTPHAPMARCSDCSTGNSARPRPSRLTGSNPPGSSGRPALAGLFDQ